MTLFSPRNYVWVPVLTALIWLGTLIAAAITWFLTGRPRYVTMEGSIPYISDIGADIFKPYFVAGCSVTGVGFFGSLVIEHWLRDSERWVI